MATGIDAPPGGALADAKAYLRIETADEDALLGTLIVVALGLCERFTGLAPLIADRTAVLAVAGGAWQRLPQTPVSAIGAVAALDRAGVVTPLGVAACATDIDAAGDGWVRVIDAGAARRVSVAYRAGLAADWAGLPAPLRQGVTRLVAHLHAHRDGEGGAGPPAAVTALWRPFRRMRLS